MCYYKKKEENLWEVRSEKREKKFSLNLRYKGEKKNLFKVLISFFLLWINSSDAVYDDDPVIWQTIHKEKKTMIDWCSFFLSFLFFSLGLFVYDIRVWMKDYYKIDNLNKFFSTGQSKILGRLIDYMSVYVGV